MRKWTFWAALWVAAISLTVQAHAAVAVRAEVDRTAVMPGESIQLTVTVKDGQGDVDTSGLTDFKVLSQGSSTSLQIINLNTLRETAYTYMLMPRRKGRLTIPALSVTVGGKSYRTAPIEVQVSDQPAPGAAADDREVWVTAAISDPAPYIGQQIAYTLTLFHRVQVTDASFQPPDFRGFTAKQIDKHSAYTKMINGREYGVTKITYVLIPLETGAHTIEPSALQLGIVRPDRRQRRSPFDDFFSDPFLNRNRVETKVLQSESVPVNIQPLPPMQNGGEFSGLVGRFDLAAAIENTQLQTGDAATVSVTVKGEGNIADAQAPPLKVPDSFKTYPDTPQEDIQLTPEGYRGQKVFRTALVPVQPGEVQLAPVQLTYFDVQSKSYRTLTAGLPPLQVKPSATAQAAPQVAAKPLTPEKQAVAIIGHDILPLKEDLNALQPQRTMGWPAFLLWLLAPALAVGSLSLAQHLRRPDTSPAARMKTKALHALAAAQKAGPDHGGFLTALYQALTAAIFSKAGRSGEALTWKEAEELLRGNGTQPETARQAAELLSAIESNNFSGGRLSADQSRDLLERTRRMVRRLLS